MKNPRSGGERERGGWAPSGARKLHLISKVRGQTWGWAACGYLRYPHLKPAANTFESLNDVCRRFEDALLPLSGNKFPPRGKRAWPPTASPYSPAVPLAPVGVPCTCKQVHFCASADAPPHGGSRLPCQLSLPVPVNNSETF